MTNIICFGVEVVVRDGELVAERVLSIIVRIMIKTRTYVPEK